MQEVAFRLPPVPRRIVISVSERKLAVNGVEVALEPRVFDVLVYLARQRPRLVRTDDLRQAVWTGKSRPQRLANYVAKARRALNTVDCQTDFIRTAYGFGYQFVAWVEWTESVMHSQDIAIPPQRV
jgi:DNA-binding winged helix-turn-helix (wHTH) protein